MVATLGRPAKYLQRRSIQTCHIDIQHVFLISEEKEKKNFCDNPSFFSVCHQNIPPQLYKRTRICFISFESLCVCFWICDDSDSFDDPSQRFITRNEEIFQTWLVLLTGSIGWVGHLLLLVVCWTGALTNCALSLIDHNLFFSWIKHGGAFVS